MLLFVWARMPYNLRNDLKGVTSMDMVSSPQPPWSLLVR
jgi:hypothetical protein